MDLNMSIIWIIAIIVFVIAEAITYQLVTIWFAIGALGALVCSVLGIGVPMQITVFLVLSIAALLFLRPVSKKYLKGSGQGKLCGMEWTVRSADNSEISAGETAVVEKIEGVKIIVSRKEN